LSQTILIDHSYLRKASQDQYAAEIQALRQLIQDRRASFVSSAITLIEIAKYPDQELNIREARLIDSLGPLWLRTRLDLIGDELLNAFHAWRGEPDLKTPINPFLVSPGQYAATGRVLVLQNGQDSAEGIVRNFHERPSLMDRIRQGESSSDYRNTLAELRRRQESSQAEFEAVRKRAEREMIRELAPFRDRAGNFTRTEEREKFIEEVDPSACPTLATEIALFYLRIQRPFSPENSELWDLQYAESALPYVDVAVFDRQFADLVRQAARRCETVRAASFSNLAEAIECLGRARDSQA
jgi:hypothetical protein